MDLEHKFEAFQKILVEDRSVVTRDNGSFWRRDEPFHEVLFFLLKFENLFLNFVLRCDLHCGLV